MLGERPDEPTGDGNDGDYTFRSKIFGGNARVCRGRRTLDNVNAEVAGGPDIPRYVIPGVAGNFNNVSTV
jgi:hypothetical protein